MVAGGELPSVAHFSFVELTNQTNQGLIGSVSGIFSFVFNAMYNKPYN